MQIKYHIKYQAITRTLQTLAMLIIIVPSVASAADGNCQCGLCVDDCACCCLKCDMGEEEKTCWQCECKQVCIPKVVFPWQKNRCNPCANNGACVRTVRVLKKKTIECPKREYKWEPKMIGGCGCCGNGCCCDGNCCDGGSCCDGGMLLGATQFSGSPMLADQGTLAAPVPATDATEIATVHVAKPVKFRQPPTSESKSIRLLPKPVANIFN